MILSHLFTTVLALTLTSQVIDVPPSSWDKLGIVAVLGVILGLSIRVNLLQYRENRQKEEDMLEMTSKLAEVISKNTSAMEAREHQLATLINHISGRRNTQLR